MIILIIGRLYINIFAQNSVNCILKMGGFYCTPFILHQSYKANMQFASQPQTFQVKILICLPFSFNLIELIYYYFVYFKHRFRNVFVVDLLTCWRNKKDLHTCSQFKLNFLALWLCVKIIIFCYTHGTLCRWNVRSRMCFKNTPRTGEKRMFR